MSDLLKGRLLQLYVEHGDQVRIRLANKTTTRDNKCFIFNIIIIYSSINPKIIIQFTKINNVCLCLCVRVFMWVASRMLTLVLFRVYFSCGGNNTHK